MKRKIKRLPIDDERVLNYYFDDRETFVVDYNDDLVVAKFTNEGVVFRLKQEG